jgi:SAM-dependent methyltransferase
MALYGSDLARIHDEGFGGFADGAAPGILSILRRHGIRRGLVVDLGCGSGRWAAALGRAGYHVLGIDASPAMLALAKRKAPRAVFRRGSLHRARLPACDAVTAIGEGVAYEGVAHERVGLAGDAYEPGPSAAGLLALFRRVHAALRPGGVLVFDLRTPSTVRAGGTRTAFTLAGAWAVLVQREVRGRRLVRRITTFRRVGNRYRRSDEVHRVRLYGAGEVLRLLRRAGFRARAFRGYGRLRFAADVVGFVARKP